jgi:hypothetical protein
VIPASPEDRRWRDVSVLAAGPLANLWLGSIALWATFTAKGRHWEQAWELLALIATFSLVEFIINLIPLRPEAEYSDGARIYQLLSGGPWVDVQPRLLNRRFQPGHPVATEGL